MSLSISRTELARNTREIVERVRQGEQVTVQGYGEDQIVLLDALDYRILRSIANYALRKGHMEIPDDDFSLAIDTYLEEKISLGKAAELLGLSRYELMDRFERLGVPLRIGPATLDEARDEVRAALQDLLPRK